MKDFNEYTEIQMTDDDTLRVIKETIDNMRPMEQRLWIDYVESGTFAALARKYNVSAPTAKTYIMRLRDKILDALMAYENNKEQMLKYRSDDEFIFYDGDDSSDSDFGF
jgi:predicted RNA polymerase sigma factor